MDFHWSHPILIGIVLVMFLTSYHYQDTVEPFLARLQLIQQASDSVPLASARTTPALSVESFANYTKCDGRAPRGILKDIFESYDIYRTRGADWDIFLPCSYTHVEQELREMGTAEDEDYEHGEHHRAHASYDAHAIARARLPANAHASDGSSPVRAIFAVDGCDALVSKNRLWDALVAAYGRAHACRLMPPSYVTAHAADMKLFVQHYDRQKMYICKKNVQRKEGLLLTGNLDTILRCHLDGYKVVQEYVMDVHTVRTHKLNIRLYVLVVCEPDGRKHAYVHDEGKCLYTAKPYNRATLSDRTSQITSVDVTKDLYEASALSNASATTAHAAGGLPLSVRDLRHFWRSECDIDDAMVWRRVMVILKDTVEAVLPTLCTNPKFYAHRRFQLFGVDVLLRNPSLEPLVLEFNKGPAMTPVNQEDYFIKRRVLEDVFGKMGFGRKGGGRGGGFLSLATTSNY